MKKKVIMKKINKNVILLILLLSNIILFVLLSISLKEEASYDSFQYDKSEFINKEIERFNSDLNEVDSILYDILFLELTSSDLHKMNFDNSSVSLDFIKKGLNIIYLLRLINPSEQLNVTDPFYNNLSKNILSIYEIYDEEVPYKDNSNIYFIRSSSNNQCDLTLNRVNIQILMAQIELMTYRFFLYKLFTSPPEKYQNQNEYKKYFEKKIDTHLFDR